MRALISCAAYFLPSMSTVQSVPMWRFTERIVRSGLVIAWRFATSPTRTSPVLENATTDGVVRAPSAFGITEGSPASSTATTELVVPRSMPTALDMGSPCKTDWMDEIEVARSGQAPPNLSGLRKYNLSAPHSIFPMVWTTRHRNPDSGSGASRPPPGALTG